jgi:predicted transcriptional regulator
VLALRDRARRSGACAIPAAPNLESPTGCSNRVLERPTPCSTSWVVSSPRKLLGDLEHSVLDTLWSSQTPLSVREVLSAVARKPPLAYTTVLTVLDRLHAKGMVVRAKQGKAFVYWARVSKEKWLGEQAAQTLIGANGAPNRALLAAFLDSAERADPQVLEHLSSLIAARRRARGR